MCQQRNADSDPFTRERIDRVHRVMLSRTRSPQTADELTQELFTQVLAVEHRFDPQRGTIDAWINGFVPIILARFHSRGRRRGREAELPQDVADTLAEDAFDRIHLRDQLRQALDRLTARDRELILRFSAGQNIKEIARALGISRSAVTTAHARARSRLVRLLEQEGLEPQEA